MKGTFTFIGLLSILLVGVVLGVQTAERGIYKIDGLPEQKPQAFYIKKVEKGELEIAVMGKQVKAQAPKAVVNYVSYTGTTVGGFVKKSAKGAIDWFSDVFQP